MVKNAKAKGTAFEHQVMDWLHKNHYPIVVRSAGSLGAVDIIAVHFSGKPILISCKYLKKYSRKKEETDMKELANRCLTVGAYLFYREKPRGKIAFKQL